MVTNFTEEEVQESADELISQVSQMTDMDEKNIRHNGQSFSPSELIEHIRKLTPVGKEYIKLSLQARERVARANDSFAR